jgi:hypothetical protein
LTFDEPNTFHIALGGDGAPFGKDDTACSWLVRILNIGHHILSRNENFLLFGANCSENCLPVRRFIAKLMTDLDRIQKKSYSVLAVNGEPVQVKFVIGELPIDMKMLEFLGGELTNSATYFSTFADLFIYLALPTRAGSPQQHMPITVGPFCLTHPVNFPCGRKPEYPEETHDFRQGVDFYSFHMRTGFESH